jgi:hypothetical protein
MANIYYSHPENRRGMLRAVLSSEETINLMKKHLAYYAGEQFPMTHQPVEADFAVLHIFEGETNGEWRSGFYQFDDDIERIEETVRSCDANQSLVALDKQTKMGIKFV